LPVLSRARHAAAIQDNAFHARWQIGECSGRQCNPMSALCQRPCQIMRVAFRPATGWIGVKNDQKNIHFPMTACLSYLMSPLFSFLF
jgi:hypothetical protein